MSYMYVHIHLTSEEPYNNEHPHLQKVIPEPLILFINAYKAKWLHIYQSLSEFHLKEALLGRHCTLWRGQFLFAATLCQEGQEVVDTSDHPSVFAILTMPSAVFSSLRVHFS